MYQVYFAIIVQIQQQPHVTSETSWWQCSYNDSCPTAYTGLACTLRGMLQLPRHAEHWLSNNHLSSWRIVTTDWLRVFMNEVFLYWKFGDFLLITYFWGEVAMLLSVEVHHVLILLVYESAPPAKRRLCIVHVHSGHGYVNHEIIQQSLGFHRSLRYIFCHAHPNYHQKIHNWRKTFNFNNVITLKDLSCLVKIYFWWDFTMTVLFKS